MNIKLKKLIPKYLTGGIPIFSPIEQKEFERNYKKMIESPSFYKLSKEDLTKLKQTWINESKKLGLGINETNKYISEKIKTYSLNSLLNNLSISNLNNLSEKESNITETPISQVYDNSNSEVSLIPNLEELISNIKNRHDSVEQPVIKGEQKKNNPPVYDSKVIESYEKDPYDDLVLSEKAKESYENWLRSRHREPGKNNWESFKTRFSLFINNPDLWATGRLAVNLGYNDRIYDEYLKGLSPVLKLSYNTYRQVFGDEATKLGYYTRAALLLTRASRPFTSNAETSLAAMFDAYAKGNEMRAEGDRADNQRIRETSELANQHLDANRLRATEVANYNIASMALTKAQKHALLAQKLSAEGSSIDNWLLGIEYRKRLKNARLDTINDLIFALDELERLSNDEDYLKAYDRWEAWQNKHKTESGTVDSSHPDYLKEKKLYNNAVILRQRKSLRRMQAYKANGTTNFDNFIYAKSGTKITKKLKDDLLYKSAKDVVEHFRKMIALDKKSSKSKNKIERLAPHPKGDTRKYLLGGVAPFLVYKPIALGGETTTTTSTDTSSTKSKSSEGKDTLDLVKSMFEKMLGKGLPVDVNSIYAQMTDLLSNYESFGSSLDTGDIALMYLQSMLRVNNAMYSKELYDKAKEYATKNEALNEFAVDAIGNFIVQDKDGNLSTAKSWKEALTGGKTPITNQQLLYLRAYDPKLASQAGDRLIENVINNGMGINKIGALIKALAGNIGTSEGKIDGLTLVESNKVKSGLLLLANAPDGYYKHTIEDKNQRAQVRAAISYITGMLSPSLKAILETHGGAETLIPMFLTSLENETYNVSIQPLTGKTSDKEDDLSKLGINSAVLMLLGMSSPREFTFSTGNGNMFNGMARVSSITKDGNPIGADFSYSDIYKSDLHKNLDLDNACFGDVPINKSLKDKIIIDNSTIAGIDLPYTTDRNGRIIPDFNMLNRIEEADNEVLLSGINPETEPQKVNEIYAKHNLPIKYGADNRLTGNYKRFAVVLATAIEDVFLDKSGLASNGTLSLVSDEEEINKYINGIKEITGNKDIDMDRPGLFTGDKDIYKGSIFIPIIGDLVDAVSATGGLKAGNYDELRSKYLTKNYNEAPLFVKQ